jgi:hypothetical protein
MKLSERAFHSLCNPWVAYILRAIGEKMVELRVTVDDKLNKLLDDIVASGLYQSKAELMRSAAVYLLLQMGVIKDHVQGDASPKKKPST